MQTVHAPSCSEDQNPSQAREEFLNQAKSFASRLLQNTADRKHSLASVDAIGLATALENALRSDGKVAQANEAVLSYQLTRSMRLTKVGAEALTNAGQVWADTTAGSPHEVSEINPRAQSAMMAAADLAASLAKDFVALLDARLQS